MAQSSLDVRPRTRDLTKMHMIFAGIVIAIGVGMMISVALMLWGLLVFGAGLIWATAALAYGHWMTRHQERMLTAPVRDSF
jgi:hypothetical protein